MAANPAVDPDFERTAESAWFVLTEAEALGVHFSFALEADYPASLTPSCIADLERAIGAHRVLITRILMERAGVAP